MISCELSHNLPNQRTSPHLAGHQSIPAGSRQPTLGDATNHDAVAHVAGRNASALRNR